MLNMIEKHLSILQDKIYSIEKGLGFKNKIIWSLVLGALFLHIFFVWCFYLYGFPVKWRTVVFCVFYIYLSGVGITAGAHRHFTHRAYKANAFLRFILVIMFTCAGHMSVREWVLTHRVHHKHSDTEADPHNSKRGFFFSHIGWLLVEKNDLVLQKEKEIDMSDIDDVPLLRWQERNFRLLQVIFSYILPTMVTMWFCDETLQTAIAWMMFRSVYVLNATLTVNSLNHTCGYRPYNKKILPTQNWLVTIISFGEGWHNYHHCFPFDYKAAESVNWYNLSTSFIRFFGYLGCASDMKEASPEMIKSYTKRMGENQPVETYDY